MGALVAHAIACALEKRGRDVAFVGLVDPPEERAGRPGDAWVEGLQMAIQILHPAPPPGSWVRRRLRQGVPAEARALLAWCEAQGLLPPGRVEIDDLRGVLGLYRRHQELMIDHVPGVCRAPLRLWRARRLGSGGGRDWARHTARDVAVVDVAASHFTIMRPGAVEVIARDLEALLGPG